MLTVVIPPVGMIDGADPSDRVFVEGSDWRLYRFIGKGLYEEVRPLTDLEVQACAIGGRLDEASKPI